MNEPKQSQSGVMKAANSAATKVSNWSPAKQNFAQKIVNAGSLKAADSATFRRAAAASKILKK